MPHIPIFFHRRWGHFADAANVPRSRPNLEVLDRVHRLPLGPNVAHSGFVAFTGAALDRRIAAPLGRWGFVGAAAACLRQALRERVALSTSRSRKGFTRPRSSRINSIGEANTTDGIDDASSFPRING